MRNKKPVQPIIWRVKGIPDPSYNLKITTSGKPYIADYAWPQLKVIVIIEKDFRLKNIRCNKCKEIVVANLDGKLTCMRLKITDCAHVLKTMTKQNDLQADGWITLRYKEGRLNYKQISECLAGRIMACDSTNWALKKIRGLV